jgi:hypothetical protein
MTDVKAPAEAKTEAEAKTAESLVDTLFDTLTERAAKALVLAGRGLAASAKWLEAQAKLVGDLAAKLEKPASPETAQQKA